MARNIAYYFILLKPSSKVSLKPAWTLSGGNDQLMKCKLLQSPLFLVHIDIFISKI